MSWLPALLGVVLGVGALLAWQGARTVFDRALDEAARRKGFWRLNAGLVLIAVSVIAFNRVVRG